MAQMPYRRERIWQQADAFAQAVEELIAKGRLDMVPYIRDQLMRAAYSAAANIAEGRGRGTAPDYGAFLDRARGSIAECDYWVLVLARRGVLSADEADRLKNWAEGISLGIWTARNGLRTASGRPVPTKRQPSVPP